MAQGEYTSNVASGVFGGVVSGAAMGGPFAVPGAVIGGLVGLGKSLIENKAAKERAAKVNKQKKKLKQRKKEIEGELTQVPDLIEQQKNLQEEQLEYESGSLIENFIEQTVGNIKNMEATKARTGLTSSDVDTQITSAEEQSAKSFKQVTDDLKRKKESLEYATEAEKASRVQGLIGDLYDLDTTIEGL